MDIDERIQEISAVVNIIHDLCIKSDISLFAKNNKGTLLVCVKDHNNGKEYGLKKGR